MALFSDKKTPLTVDDNSGEAQLELDVSAAIQAHVQWKQRLLNYIEGNSKEKLDPEVVGSDCLCALGQWIYGHGEANYGDHATFHSLKVVHAEFHAYAADVVQAVHAGEREHALGLLQKGEYPKVSNRIKSMLAGLSLEFDFS
jgi:hypothetical protein